jgi:small-conductance mechanosensitive channel
MDTVLKQPISTVLATSGVLAIVLGLALQNTLADVFSGIAINVERPFGAGDWITMPDHVEGQVIEINWRATRIRTSSNDIVVIPNSVIAKAVVTNHRRLNDPHLCALRVKVDHTVPPMRVIDTLQAAAGGSAGIAPDTSPVAYACEFIDSLIVYEICFGVDDFALTSTVQSEVIRQVADAFQGAGIPIGTAAMDVRIVRNGVDAHPKRVAAIVGAESSAS